MIYITGDTHGDYEEFKERLNNYDIELNFNNYLIICGDFGFIFDNDKKKVNTILNKLSRLNINILFLDGNHENFEILEGYSIVEWNGGKVHQIKKNIFHLMRGEIYNLNDLVFFVMGGAYSIDKAYRTENISWWERELPSKKELDNGLKNLKKCNYKVDYILSHDCSRYMVDKLYRNNIFKVEDDKKLKDFFDLIEDLCDFKHWYFGHHHMYYHIDNKHTCLYQEITKIKGKEEN